MTKEEVAVVAVLEQPDRVQDIGDFDVQLSMGNLVITDRRGGLPRGYGTYTYLPYHSLTPQWKVVPDVRGQATSLRARIDGHRVVIGVVAKGSVTTTPSTTSPSAATSSHASGASGAIAAAAVGLAGAALNRWLKKKADATSAPDVTAVASPHEHYENARRLQERGEHDAAARAFRSAVTVGEGDKASLSVAASLFQLGRYEVQKGDVMEARILLGRSAEFFEAAARKARAEGRDDVAAMAEAEAGRVRSIAITAATGKPWLAPDFTGSESRAQQLDKMSKLDEDRMRTNQNWAQGLGRI